MPLSAQVVAQFRERLALLDRGLDFLGLGPIESFAGGQADQRHGTGLEPLADFAAALGVEFQFDGVGVPQARAQFDAKHSGLGAVGNCRRQVPVLAPLVRGEAEAEVRRFGVSREGPALGNGHGGGRRAAAVHQETTSRHSSFFVTHEQSP